MDKQPECPSTGERITKMWCEYKWNITQPLKTMSYCHLQQHDGPRHYHTSEVSQTKKDKYQMISLICRIFKKNDTNDLIYKTEIDSQT